MDFVNRNLSSAFKIILAIVIMLIFIKTIPVLIIVGIVAWAGNKGMKFFKNRKSKESTTYKKMNVNPDIYSAKDSFDITGKNVIDVEYREMKK